MLTLLRRLIRHPLGAAVALAFVILLGIGFVLSDHSGLTNGGLNAVPAGDVVATVGDKKITRDELIQTIRRDVDTLRQQQPQADMAGYLANGGLEATLDRLITSTATRQFAEKQGMVVSKRAVDGIIASFPGLQGPDGKFDQKAYDQALKAQGSTDEEARVQLTAQVHFRNLIVPATTTSQVPLQLAIPYANLLLEQRDGQIAAIPIGAVGPGAPPTAAELAEYYQRNAGQYRVPQRRLFRYALVTPATVAAQAAPTDAEIAAAYQRDAGQYATAELRTIAQVIVADPTAAAALAARVKGGASIEQAAKVAGLVPATFKDQKQADYAAQSTDDIARSAFSARQGDVIGPLRAPLGYVVARVEAVRTRPARTLAEVTPELRKKLTAQKTATLLVARRNAIDDALSRNSKFDPVVSQNGLTVQHPQALTAQGIDIADPAAKPDAALAPMVGAAFAAAPADGAQTVPTDRDGSFAVVTVDRVLPAAPLPLAQVRDVAARDFQIARANRAVRQIAGKVVAAVNGGSSLAQALAATGLKLPPPQSVKGPRAQLIADPQRVPPPIVLLFSMKARTAKLTAAPNRGGYLIVYLDSITPGDARSNPKVVAGTRSDIGKVIGREYGDELAKAMQQVIGVRKNSAAIAAVKAELSGTSAPDQP